MSEATLKVRMRRGNMAGLRANAVVTPPESEAKRWLANGWCDLAEEPKAEKRQPKAAGG